MANCRTRFFDTVFMACYVLDINERNRSGPSSRTTTEVRERPLTGESRIANVDAWFKELPAWLQAQPARVGRLIRVAQWWDYKLVPICSIFYATAYIQHVPVAVIWPDAVALLLAIAPCAAYVSLVNDLTDRADDSRAGKANRMAGRPAWQMSLILAAPLCVAVVFTMLWRDD